MFTTEKKSTTAILRMMPSRITRLTLLRCDDMKGQPRERACEVRLSHWMHALLRRLLCGKEAAGGDRATKYDATTAPPQRPPVHKAIQRLVWRNSYVNVAMAVTLTAGAISTSAMLSHTSTWVQNTYDVMDEEHQLAISLFALDRALERYAGHSPVTASSSTSADEAAWAAEYHLENLRGLISDNAAQQRRVGRIADLVLATKKERSQLHSPAEIARMLRGKAYQVRALETEGLLAEFEQDERVLLGQRREAQRRALERLESLAAVAVAVGVGALIFIRRNGKRLIREAEVYQQRLRDQAFHDPLTNLANRRLLEERFALSCATARRKGEKLAVVLVDLDGFKRVNDTHGHSAGDALLVGIGKNLSEGLRASDTVARLGGDEFVLVMRTPPSPEELGKVALDALSRPIAYKKLRLVPEASVGIALYPDAGDDLATLLRCADAAMYVAKANGKGGVAVYSGEPATPRETAATDEALLR
ncbi:diguanylate cyclase domain-containing protein [Paraburkholderia phenazinium]|uniref:diguanylate cyclase domain-containing protein n=1 Tax=Paraburkholderia phenazinium TaxID=60549 RepID=UPI00158DB23B|nr:diguanylate cyclase [Paraburkholderia phenazinium]